MDTFRRIDACRICGNTGLAPIVSLGEQYLTGVFPRTRGEVLTRGPLTLVKCTGNTEACGLVQLQHSYTPAEMYGDRYGYRSSLNKSMVAHLQLKAQKLLRLAPLRDGDVVLDIGSNDGTLLSFYPGSLVRVGMDPTAAKFSRYYQPGIQFVSDFFSAKQFDSEFGGKKANIVTSIAMFYDLDNPLAFIEEIGRILHDDGIWHFEQSYMPRMLETGGYDTICHEHVEYYALSQIDWMMRRSGMRILDVELNDVNGGSFGVTVCKDAARFPSATQAVNQILAAEELSGLRTSAPFEKFASRVQQHREELPSLLSHISSSGCSTLGYGASTKGNVILQFCGITSADLPFIAEVNEEKFGAFTPGTGIPIISEQQAQAMMPDYFLALPWHFRSTLLDRERDFLERGGKMIFPLPEIEVVQRQSR